MKHELAHLWLLFTGLAGVAAGTIHAITCVGVSYGPGIYSRDLPLTVFFVFGGLFAIGYLAGRAKP